jgi:ribosome-binding factor A
VTRRTERVGEELRAEISEIIGRRLKDPRVGFVTVTRASVTDDLRVARVYVSVLGDQEQRDDTLAGLERAAGFIRRELGRRLRLRRTPELIFVFDPGIEATERVAKLLEEVAPTDRADGEPE